MKNPQGQSHWCVIRDRKSLSRLISSNISKAKQARHICTLCHQATFTTEAALERHDTLCKDHDAQITKLPTKKDYIMFKNEHKKIRPPISIYVNFECSLPKIDIEKGKSSKITSEHVPSGFGFYVKSRYKSNYPRMSVIPGLGTFQRNSLRSL